MVSKTCMNVSCDASTSTEWCKGWALRSGEYASLCYKCGSIYEQSLFCDVFHSKDSGWRECISCRKLLHCGCIASKFLLDLLDSGGVNCVSCSRSSRLHIRSSDNKPNEFDLLTVKSSGYIQPTSADNQFTGWTLDKMKNMQILDDIDGIGPGSFNQAQNDNTASLGLKHEDVLPPAQENVNLRFSKFNTASSGSPQVSKLDSGKANVWPKDTCEPFSHTNLSISLGSPLGNQNIFPVVERDHCKSSSSFQQEHRSRHFFPKPPKTALSVSFEANAGMVSQVRVARPPAEGRGKNQLLPRYWPRITDQELQRISEDSNSIIVPLFEKVLSASDAGRIGRLVLPKACAEAYFPPISQPEGLPLRIQDVKGKEWVFQFRFWPNNNSRMYVLEGVTPCIQSMQLQAGDTVTFSRMDPEGKLVMGFRKASTPIPVQDQKPSTIPNGSQSSESFFSGVFEHMPGIRGYSGLLQSLKGTAEPHLNALSKQCSSATGDFGWNTQKSDGWARDGLLMPPLRVPERKRARHIGTKSKRLLIDSQDALDLKLTWEEAQDLICPPRSVKPSIILVEANEFEEYEEPPVFGKRGIFIVRSNGGQEQWAQCDNCFKWRRLPVDMVLPSKWTCSENAPNMSSCSTPDELNPKELENLLRLNKEFKKQRLTCDDETLDIESSGLNALAIAAVLGDNVCTPSSTSVAVTTKHPRHRSGCSCIVCSQPPSGKGKHKPTCTCNVCMTVRRRFKTLMLRKKKRQSEREAEIAQRNQHTWGRKNEPDVESSSRHLALHLDSSENEGRMTNKLEFNSQSNSKQKKLFDIGKGEIDLNFDPCREEEGTPVSMMSLLQLATHPLETYLKQNGLTSLVSEEVISSASKLPQPANGDEGGVSGDCCFGEERVQESESGAEENGPDKSENDSI